MSVFRCQGRAPDPVPGVPARPVFVHRRNEELVRRVIEIKRAREADSVRLAS